MTSLATSAPPPPLEICPVTRVDGEKCELVYSAYTGEEELQSIMDLIDSTLSEPYSIFTYRYFINTWPSLCILTRSRPVGSSVQGELMGVIICKADVHTKSKVKRGYLAMLVVDKTYRKLKIGTKLAVMAINEMGNLDCKEAVLETEITNKGALRLYERLGFIRQKRLPKYYLNGNDAYRLKLWIPSKETPPEEEEKNGGEQEAVVVVEEEQEPVLLVD
jgi:peptide alpha-N-acetyltransferase